jgi:hypothetical protein
LPFIARNYRYYWRASWAPLRGSASCYRCGWAFRLKWANCANKGSTWIWVVAIVACKRLCCSIHKLLPVYGHSTGCLSSQWVFKRSCCASCINSPTALTAGAAGWADSPAYGWVFSIWTWYSIVWCRWGAIRPGWTWRTRRSASCTVISWIASNRRVCLIWTVESSRTKRTTTS